MGHGAKQAAYLDWKVSLLGNIECSRTINAKGAVFADFTPLPELARAARRGLLRRRQEAPELGLPQGAHAARAGGLVHGRRQLHVAVEGPAGADAGGSGRIEICVEAMSPGSRERLVQYLRDTHGAQMCVCAWRAQPRRRFSSSPQPRRRNSRSWWLLTCTPRWTTSSCRASGSSSASSRVRRA